MRPEIRFAQLLEAMPVKAEYREAVAAAIQALRSRQLREERSLHQEREAGLQRVIQGYRETERKLLDELAALRELVHPAGTWTAGKSQRRKKLKSLYCCWIGRWGSYRVSLLELARADSAQGLRWYPDTAKEHRMKEAARALFDAAVEFAQELDDHERKQHS